MSGGDMEIRVDKTVNLPMIAAMFAFVFGLGGWNTWLQGRIGTTEDRIAGISETIKNRVTLADQKYSDLQATTYRLGIVEGNVSAINNRLDNSFNRLGERLDRLAQSQAEGFSANVAELATIKTNIAVLTQRLDALGNQKRAEFYPIGPRPIIPAAR